MASIRKVETKEGVFYEIGVRRGRKQPRVYTRWKPSPTWSAKTVQKKLEDYARDFERQVKDGKVVTRKEQKEREAMAAEEAAKILTVRQYAEKVYLPAKKVRLAESTRDSYQRCFDNWIFPAIGDRRIDEVTPEEIDSLLLNLQSDGKAHSSCVKCYAVLSGLFKRARKKRVILVNPMDLVDRPTPRKDEIIKEEPDSCTVAEVRYILECLDKEPLKWRAYIRLLIDTGCRRGEIAALKWSAVDFASDRISIVSNACYTPGAGSYLDTPKSRRTRTVDVGPDVMALLKEVQREQVKNGISQFVFPKRGKTSEPMFATTPTKYLATFSDRYGISIHPHMLRHSYASIGITNGADVASIAENLGHSDKAVTLRMYTDANKESRKRASSIVRDSIKEEPPKDDEKTNAKSQNLRRSRRLE